MTHLETNPYNEESIALMARNARAATTENSGISHGPKDVLSHEEGLLVGVSAGAAMVAALKGANQLSSGVVVTIFPDSSEKYPSERFWDEGQ
ncbi:MAG: hypothetical protein ABSF14_24205 [Terriglobia bacterium]